MLEFLIASQRASDRPLSGYRLILRHVNHHLATRDLDALRSRAKARRASAAGLGERWRFLKGTGSYFCAGCKMSFCTRQFKSSATNKVFSEGQAISCTQPNWPSCLPGLPNAPRIFPSRSSL